MRITDNRVRSLIGLYTAGLAGRYGSGEVKAILRAVFEQGLQWDAAQLEMRRDEVLSESELVKVYTPFERLQAGEPLQYVLGEVHFHGLSLGVAPGVLIPRPETEELVQRIIEDVRTPSHIVDIGTGSGCIALALKGAYPEAQVVAIDRSAEALAIAEVNGARNGLRVEWMLANILDPDLVIPPTDLIVSNPPYVPRSEEASLDSVVRDNEPHIALFVEDDDPLLFYRAIAHQALQALSKGGHLWFEGHYRYATGVGELLSALGFTTVEVLHDLSGNPRYIHAVR
jgi:release factor glutamine methyltransferase